MLSKLPGHIVGSHTSTCLHTDVIARGKLCGAFRTEAAFHQERGILRGAGLAGGFFCRATGLIPPVRRTLHRAGPLGVVSPVNADTFLSTEGSIGLYAGTLHTRAGHKAAIKQASFVVVLGRHEGVALGEQAVHDEMADGRHSAVNRNPWCGDGRALGGEAFVGTVWLGGVIHQPLVSSNFTVRDDLPTGQDTVICSIVVAGATLALCVVAKQAVGQPDGERQAIVGDLGTQPGDVHHKVDARFADLQPILLVRQSH